MKIRFYISSIFVGTFIFLQCTVISDISHQQIIKGPEFSPYEGLKTSIAIIDFENRTDHGGEKFGSAVADMLVSLLVKSDRFMVMERQRIHEIFQEQALGQSGAIAEETAAHAGQLLGVQALILGDILEVEQKTDSHRFKDRDDEDEKDAWELALKATVGHVKFHYRMVHTITGEILLSDDVSTTEMRPGFGIKTKEFDFEDMHELDQTILGFAVRKAVNEMATAIVRNAHQLKWEGKIIQIKDEENVVYFTPGRNSGVHVGDKFKVWAEISADELEVPNDFQGSTKIMDKGIVEVIGFIGDRVSKAVIVEGNSMNQGDRLSALTSN